MLLYKWMKYPFFGKYMTKWENPLTDEEKKEWESISTRSKSGGVIKGMFARTKGAKARATVVLGHPMGKEAKGYFLKRGYTDLLREEGFNVVIFDLNGFGESSHGSFSYFEDIVAIGIKTKALTPDLPIGYFGISLGASWATIAFADKTHPYDFAIIESAATSLQEFWIHFPVAYKALKFINFIMPKYIAKLEMIERIKEAKRLRGLLLIYCQKDRWVPLEMGKRFAQNSPVPTQLWVAHKARHAQIMSSPNKDVYQEKILAFLEHESHMAQRSK